MGGTGKPSPADCGEGLWPDPLQLTLLKAALWSGEEALAAWQEWSAQVDLSGAIDRITYRLLPLLYCNMQAHGQRGRGMAHLKGLYRNTWYRNNRMFDALRPFVQALDAAGFRLMFLKGVPLAQAYYPRLGARPMSDVDILVPLEQAEALLLWMFEQGYSRERPDPGYIIARFHSQPYYVAGQEVDLHWHLLRDCADPALAETVWDQAQPFAHAGVAAWTLGPADMLLHQVLHGLRWNEEPSIRWIPDAWTVIKRSGAALDWQRLVALCRRFAYCERCHLGLRFLHDALGAEVPDWVLAELSRSGSSLVERMERSYVLKDHRALYAQPLGKLWITFTDYQSQGRRRKYLPHLAGFSLFVAARWRATGRMEIAQSVLRGSLKRLRQRV